MFKNLLSKSAPKNYLKANAAFLAANLIWGAANPIIKYTLDYIPPFTFLFLRFLIIGIVVFPIIYFQLKKEPIHKEDYLNFFLLGLFSQTALALTFVGLKYTSALDFTIIGIMSSVLTVYAGHYFFKDQVNKGIKIGLIIASLGTVLIVLEPALQSGSFENTVAERILGNVLALCNAVTWMIYIVWSKFSMGQKSGMLKKTLSFIHIKPMKRKYSATTIVMMTFYVALFTFIPLAVLENIYTTAALNFDILTIGIKGVLGLLYTALISSIVAVWLNQWGLEHTKVSDYAIFGYLAPVFTLPFAYLILHEVPNMSMYVGTAFIACGVAIAEANNRNV